MIDTLTRAQIASLSDDDLRALSRANNALAARLQREVARYQRQRVQIERERKTRRRAWREARS